VLKEFQGFTTPDDGRKFTELYNVQHLASNKIDPVSKQGGQVSGRGSETLSLLSPR
jgi:hypothetical protein